MRTVLPHGHRHERRETAEICGQSKPSTIHSQINQFDRLLDVRAIFVKLLPLEEVDQLRMLFRRKAVRDQSLLAIALLHEHNAAVTSAGERTGAGYHVAEDNFGIQTRVQPRSGFPDKCRGILRYRVHIVFFEIIWKVHFAPIWPWCRSLVFRAEPAMRRFGRV